MNKKKKNKKKNRKLPKAVEQFRYYRREVDEEPGLVRIMGICFCEWCVISHQKSIATFMGNKQNPGIRENFPGTDSAQICFFSKSMVDFFSGTSFNLQSFNLDTYLLTVMDKDDHYCIRIYGFFKTVEAAMDFARDVVEIEYWCLSTSVFIDKKYHGEKK